MVLILDCGLEVFRDGLVNVAMLLTLDYGLEPVDDGPTNAVFEACDLRYEACHLIEMDVHDSRALDDPTSMVKLIVCCHARRQSCHYREFELLAEPPPRVHQPRGFAALESARVLGLVSEYCGGLALVVL